MIKTCKSTELYDIEYCIEYDIKTEKSNIVKYVKLIKSRKTLNWRMFKNGNCFIHLALTRTH